MDLSDNPPPPLAINAAKQPPTPREVEFVSPDYQPSKAELEETVKAPDDLMDLPLKERLEEGARRLLAPVKIRRTDKPR